MCEAAKEAVWSRSLLAELVFRKEATPVTLYADNKARSRWQTTRNFIKVPSISMTILLDS